MVEVRKLLQGTGLIQNESAMNTDAFNNEVFMKQVIEKQQKVPEGTRHSSLYTKYIDNTKLDILPQCTYLSKEIVECLPLNPVKRCVKFVVPVIILIKCCSVMDVIVDIIFIVLHLHFRKSQPRNGIAHSRENSCGISGIG